MTVIAWDGKTIAADRQCTTGGMRSTAKKLFRVHTGEVIALLGDWSRAMAVKDWYVRGGDPKLYPDFQLGEDWVRVVVLRDDGLWTYEHTPFPIRIEDEFIAYGAGAEFAMGAMAMGADARRAVEVASQFSTGCGLGCDTMRYEKPAARKAAVARPRR